MFCPNCGANIPDGTAFCPNCGGATNQAAPQGQPMMYQQPAPVVGVPGAGAALAFGITALAVAWIPYIDILSIVFGILAIVKANQANRIAHTGKATTGKILGIIGLVCGAIMFFVYLYVLIWAVDTVNTYNYYRYW